MHSALTPGRLALVAALLCLCAPPELSAQENPARLAERGGVTVHGEVVDHRSGFPVSGSEVALFLLPSETLRLGPRAADGAGRFRFPQVPPGSYLLTVTAPSYGTMTDSVEVAAARSVHLVLPLSRGSRALHTRVVDARASGARRGFDARLRGGGGFIVTREDIEASGAARLTDLLVQMQGARVVLTPPAGQTLLLRDGCRPGVWLNGARMRNAPPLDRVVSLHAVAAVEVYHGFELPAEFGVDPCGGVLIWTRTGPAPSEALTDASIGDLIRRTAVVAGLVVLAVFAFR